MNALNVITLVLCLTSAYAIPAGFTTFFFAQNCPSGWYPLVTAEGRLIVSVSSAQNAGITVNQPLQDQEDRVHVHTFDTTFDLPSKSVAAIDCCNDQGACNDQYPIVGTLDKTTSNYPFVQLLLCTIKQQTDDPVPIGTIAYFEPSVQSCPQQWQALEQGNGRFLVAGYSNEGVITSSAAPLANGEDRTHSHSFSTTIQTNEVSYEGVDGCCNSNTAASGSYLVSGNSSEVSSGLPYIQLLTCVSQIPTFDSKFPPETMLFNEVSCPPNWNNSVEAPGRFLVALPNGAEAGATFGGPSLRPAFTGNPQHQHSFEGSVSTRSCGVGLASGCCGGGYAENGVYQYKDTSQDAEIELPYLSVPMCMQL